MKNKDTTTKVSVNSKEFLYENWTQAAIDCYEHLGSCKGCIMRDICSRQPRHNPYNLPPMRYTVLRLIEKHGEPDVSQIKETKAYTRDFEKQLEADLKHLSKKKHNY